MAIHAGHFAKVVERVVERRVKVRQEVRPAIGIGVGVGVRVRGGRAPTQFQSVGQTVAIAVGAFGQAPPKSIVLMNIAIGPEFRIGLIARIGIGEAVGQRDNIVFPRVFQPVIIMIEIVGAGHVHHLPELQARGARCAIGLVVRVPDPRGETVSSSRHVAPRIIPEQGAADVRTAHQRHLPRVAGRRREINTGGHRVGVRGQLNAGGAQRRIGGYLCRRHVLEDDHMRLAIAAELRRLGNDDGRQQLAHGPHLARGAQRRLARAGSHNLEAVQPVRVPVVHIGHRELDGVLVGIIPLMLQVDVIGREDHTFSRIAAIRSTVELDGEERQRFRVVQIFRKVPRILHADFPAGLDIIAVLARPIEVEPVGIAARVDGADQFRVVALGFGQARVGPRRFFRAGPLAQAHADGGRPASRQVGIGEAPSLRIIAVHVAGRDTRGLLPCGIDVAIAIGFASGAVVVAGVAVFNAVPDLAHGWVRTHHHAVFRAAERVAVGGGPLDIPLRALGIQIERLLEGVIYRAAIIPIEECARGNQVEALLEAGARLAIVVVWAIGNGAQIQIGHLPNAHHVGFARNIGGAARPDDLPAVAIIALLARGTCFVAEHGARRQGRNLRLPPVGAVGAIADPIAFHHERIAVARRAARPLRPGHAIGGVIEVHTIATHLRRLDADIERRTRGIGQRRPELGISHTRAILHGLRIVVNP